MYKHQRGVLALICSLFLSCAAFGQSAYAQDVNDTQAAENTGNIVDDDIAALIEAAADIEAAANTEAATDTEAATENKDVSASDETSEPLAAVENKGMIWHHLFENAAAELRGDKKSNQPEINLDFALMLGVDKDLKASSDVLSLISEYAKGNALPALLDVFQVYREAQAASRKMIGNEVLDAIQKQDKLTPDEKIALTQTFLPALVHNATYAGELIALRRYREMVHSYDRIWPDRKMKIVCQNDNNAIKFSIDVLNPATPLSGKMSTPDLKNCESAGISCYTIIESDVNVLSEGAFEQSMARTLAALRAKDTSLIAGEIDGLCRMMGTWEGQFEIDENQPKGKNWLCQLQTISLMLLEQQRFAELSRLEKWIQKVFPDASFLHRLNVQKQCGRGMPSGFTQELSRLEADYNGLYDWIRREFDPTHVKKLDKAFAAWTTSKSKKKKNKTQNKVASDAFLSRRLIAAWTLWSDGKYEKAAQFAGDVAAQKSRIVHPQINSFAIMLKAIKKETISPEDMAIYVRVIRLKCPWLVYQTLAEAGRWFSRAQRNLVVDVMSQYPPADASAEAALFYREYEPEFRMRMSADRLVGIDAWLESELRSSETKQAANDRRKQWFRDLVEVRDWAGIAKLAALSINDSPDENWAHFWASVGCYADALGDENTQCQVDCSRESVCECAGADSPEARLLAASACLQK